MGEQNVTLMYVYIFKGRDPSITIRLLFQLCSNMYVIGTNEYERLQVFLQKKLLLINIF